MILKVLKFGDFQNHEHLSITNCTTADCMSHRTTCKLSCTLTNYDKKSFQRKAACVLFSLFSFYFGTCSSCDQEIQFSCGILETTPIHQNYERRDPSSLLAPSPSGRADTELVPSLFSPQRLSRFSSREGKRSIQPLQHLSKMADAGVEKDLLLELQNAFYSDKKNLVAQNVGTQYDPLEVCLDRNVAETVNHVYKHKVL